MYQLQGSNTLFDILTTVVENRGIIDVEKFLKPSPKDTIHYSNLQNMDKAVYVFNNHKEKASEVAVVVDSDAD